jgi:hypothetical protein
MLPISSRGRPYMTSSTLTVQCCMGCMRGASAVLTLLTAPAWPALLRTTEGIVLQAETESTVQYNTGVERQSRIPSSSQ